MDLDRRKRLFDRVERVTEVPMLILAVIFLVAILAPEIADLSEEAVLALEAISWIVWGAFAFELVLKTYLAPERTRYLITHWVDVLSVLVPFLRPLRFLRVVAVGLRFWEEARTVLRKRTFSVIGTTSLLAVIASAVLIFVAERGGDGPIQTFPDALWWALATITTVGYGDVYPKTNGGRGVAVFLMLVGISLFGLLTARVAAYFVEGDEKSRDDEVLARLERIERLLDTGDAKSAPADHD
jgi:voltage-gated potassium channel